MALFYTLKLTIFYIFSDKASRWYGCVDNNIVIFIFQIVNTGTALLAVHRVIVWHKNSWPGAAVPVITDSG